MFKILFFWEFVIPVAVLFSAVFCVARLQKKNEITALVTSGVNLKTLFLLFVVLAILAGGMLLALDEFVLPAVSTRLVMLEATLKEEGKVRETAFLHSINGEDWWFFVEHFDLRKKVMEKVFIDITRKGGEQKCRIKAEKIKWKSSLKKWVMYDAKIYKYHKGKLGIIEREGKRPVVEVEYVARKVIDINFDPYKPQKRGFLAQAFTLSEALSLAKRFPHKPAFALRFHTKIWFPLTALVLLLLGFPLAVNAKITTTVGTGLCFVVSLLFYLTCFFFIDLGISGKFNPIFCAWFPFCLFLIFGIVLFMRIRS
jgi:lipopolysaccharide export LptBFGC system permease protein LptF